MLLDVHGNPMQVQQPQVQPQQPSAPRPGTKLDFVFPAGQGRMNPKMQPGRISYTGMLTLPKHGACFIEGFRPFESFDDDRASGGSLAQLTLVRARDRVKVGEIGGIKLGAGMKPDTVVPGYVLATDLGTVAIHAKLAERRVYEDDVCVGTAIVVQLSCPSIKPARPIARCA